MKMTTKLVSLLTILFVFFKFGEPAQVMMSIYGDKGFLFHSKALTTTDVVGFVYEDANGAFDAVNCTGTSDTTYLKLQDDCSVLSAVTVAETPTVVSTVEAAETAALRLVAVSNFPATGLNTNMMVARLEATNSPLVGKTLTELGTGSTAIVTITAVVTASGASADATASEFLCNNLTVEHSKTFFTASTSSFGLVNDATTGLNKYLPIMKCVGAVRSEADASGTISYSAFATFVLIATNHAQLTGSLSLLAFRSVVLLPQSIIQNATAGTVVGYINGIDKCPTTTNFTFDPSTASTAPCKAKLSINAPGSDSFLSLSYNGTAYYLPVTDASGTTTCAATTTTTCEDFVFNFKYSNKLIGMLLIFMLKMLQNY